MTRSATAIWQCFGVWLLLVATVVPHVHPSGPRHLAEQSREEKEDKEEKNGPGEEERAKEAVAHAARRLGRGHRVPGLARVF
jgi:hypothetical protein